MGNGAWPPRHSSLPPRLFFEVCHEICHFLVGLVFGTSGNQRASNGCVCLDLPVVHGFVFVLEGLLISGGQLPDVA